MRITTTITSRVIRSIEGLLTCIDADFSIVARLGVALRPAKFRIIEYHGTFGLIRRRYQTWLRRKLTVKRYWKQESGLTRWTMCCPRAAARSAPGACCSNWRCTRGEPLE